MKCPNCGKETTNNSKFCMHCGALQGGVPQQAVTITPATQKKPIYKKWWFWLLIIILILTARSIYDRFAPKQNNSPTQFKHYFDYDNDDEEDDSSVLFSTGNIYKGHKCSISVKDGQDDNINFLIKNDSKQNYNFAVHSCAINGVMTDCSTSTMYTKVPSGKKANATLDLSEWLDNDDVVEYVDVLFWVYGNSTKSFDTGVLRIKTDVYNGTIKSFSEGSQKTKTKGLSVSFYGVEDNEVICSVVNNNDYMVDYDLENVSVNDWAFDTFIQVYDVELFPNSQSVFVVDVDDDFLEENSIKKIKNFEFNLVVRKNGDFFDESSTKKIKFNDK